MAVNQQHRCLGLATIQSGFRKLIDSVHMIDIAILSGDVETFKIVTIFDDYIFTRKLKIWVRVTEVFQRSLLRPFAFYFLVYEVVQSRQYVCHD